MLCRGCGNTEAYRIRSGYYKNEQGQRTAYDVCDKCGDVRNISLSPDVSDVKEPYFDPNLCDKEHKHGQWISSRGHKAEILKKLGLREKRESNIPYIKDLDKRRKWFKNNFADA